MEKMTIEGTEYVLASELAKARDVKNSTVYMAARAGRLTAVPMMGRVFIPAVQAEAWHPQQRGGDRGGGRPRKSPAPDSAPAKEGGGDG